jgi:phthiodiolone/phenolphthiodiolone dimycocerosates ketoreductase
VNKNSRIRFGTRVFLRSHEPFQNIVQRARFCEKLGFDSIFIDDHLLYGTGEAAAPEPFTTLTALAVQTKNIRVGIAVTDLVRRHPATVAQASSTLATMAPGRFFLGLGAGDPMNQAPFGLPTENRYKKLREGFKVLRTLWSSSFEKPVSFNGKFFNLKNAYLQTGLSDKARVPVYLASFGERMLRLTGQEADGWLPHCHTPETYNHDLGLIRDAARTAGRRMTGFLPCYYTLASASRNGQLADERVVGPARYFLALIPEALKKVDPSAQHPGRIWERMTVPREQREMIRKIASTIPEGTALDTVIHGTPEDCIEQIARFEKAGCRELMLTFVPDEGLWSTRGILPSIRFFAERIIRHFS